MVNQLTMLIHLLLALALSGCVLLNPHAAPVRVTQRPLVQPEDACARTFITHDLDHVTTVPGGDEVRMFEANGGGVAINDLDNDGDLDIVLANHRDPNTILWNDGNLLFRTERMEQNESRAVTIIDLDGDGWLDIVFSSRASAPTYWHNLGNGTFEREVLPGLTHPLYAINWADLDGDGDLDLVGGTYDAGLLADFGQEFLESNLAGVYVYENDAGHFRATKLANNAQALALVLVDLNNDQRLDIIVGNDFAVPDYTWLNMGDINSTDGWKEAIQPVMSHSTMSFDYADIDNDGTSAIFSTDMMPYATDAATQAAWKPIMDGMMDDPHSPDDPQVMANVLRANPNIFAPEGEITEREIAVERGIAATGWSWSGKFGDLDQDGFVDLYVVNGMIESTTFAHLPNHELVEENQALRNDGAGRFRPMPEWQLNATHSGRGMSMADLDGDGDLDIVVNNLRGPAQLFENQLCTGSSIQVDLRWPESGNSRSIGAELLLHTSEGIYRRQVKALSGYLSGDAARVHFGVLEGIGVEKLEVRWPDGVVSEVLQIQIGSLMTIRPFQNSN